jgi:hypothetical protein
VTTKIYTFVVRIYPLWLLFGGLDKMNNGSSLKIDPDFALTENVVEASHKQNFITELVIHEVDDGFYITVKLAWSGDKIWYLTTRRDKDSPRIFKSLSRLNEYLKEKVYTKELKFIRS